MALLYDCTKGYCETTWIRAYVEGDIPPRYPVPAIPYEVHWWDFIDGYPGIVYIQNPNNPDDWDYAYDGWTKQVVTNTPD